MMPFRWPGPRHCRQMPSTPTSPARSDLDLLEGADPGDLLADGQQMDLVRPLVGKDRLEIGHMPHHRIFEADSVCAQNATRLAGDLQCLPHVVHLGHRDLRRRRLALILETTKL